MSGIIISGINHLEIYGDTIVKATDYQNDERLTDQNITLDFDDKIETVEDGFLERVPHLWKIIIAPSVKYIGVTPAAEKLLHKNSVLICGEFDSSAEEFARNYRLCFHPSDIKLAVDGDYFKQGVDIITLRIKDDGTAYINQDERCQGGCASWTGGGEIDVDINWDFFKDPNAQETIANKCWGNCREQIRQSEKFKIFLEKARVKYATHPNRKLIIDF